MSIYIKKKEVHLVTPHGGLRHQAVEKSALVMTAPGSASGTTRATLQTPVINPALQAPAASGTTPISSAATQSLGTTMNDNNAQVGECPVL